MKRYAPLGLLLSMVPLLAFGPGERVAPTKWALVIGIGDYINFGDVEGGDLPGAENDARGWRDYLIMKGGVPEQNVHMLLSRQATRDAIKEGITGWLAKSARPDDQITVVYAGHGSQMWDENGDEDDGLDETLAPADVLRENTSKDISDDEFGAWLAMLPTTNVVVVLDNCNSGTGTRSVTPFSRSRQLGRDLSKLPKPPSVARRAIADPTDKSGFNPPGKATVLELAASQPDQAAIDAYFPAEDGAEAFHGGAFSTYMLRELWRAPAGTTYEEAFKKATEALKRNRFQQDPYISEDVALKDDPLFFVEGAAATVGDASVPILSATGNTAELAGGVTLGFTRGSVFETPGGAQLVVESVGQSSSHATVASGKVAKGDPARLVGYHYATSPLRVNTAGIDSQSSTALRQALAGAPGITLVSDAESFSHLLVRRRGTELRVVGADGFVRHDSIPLGDEGAQRLAGILKQEAAAKQLADMENPGQPFEVSIGMEGGKTSFGIGETVSFHATSTRDGYLTLVDLGTDGKVVMLFPNAHQPATRIKAGETLTFPTEDMGFELQIFPPPGRGLVRAFVTPEPLDVPMDGEYPEGDERFAAAIAAAVRKAAGEVQGAVRLDTWATASLVYDIHD